MSSRIFVAEFQEDIRTIIPVIAERLNDPDSDVCRAALGLLSRLAAQGMCYHDFWLVCSSLFLAEFKEDVRITIPAIVEHLKSSDSDVCKAALDGVSMMAAQGMYQRHFLAVVLNIFVAEFKEDVRITIPAIAERLRDSVSDVREAAI